MSGCSSSGPQSPRSDHSNIDTNNRQNNKKSILKDISITNDDNIGANDDNLGANDDNNGVVNP